MVWFILGIAAGLGISNFIHMLTASKAGNLSYCDYCKYKKTHYRNE